MSALRVVIDGEPLPDSEARAFWKRFSDWMEEHPSDLAGFAGSEGFASVHPEMHEAGPVLIASRTGEQRPYGPAPKRSGAAAGPAPASGRDGGQRAKPASRRKKSPAPSRRRG